MAGDRVVWDWEATFERRGERLHTAGDTSTGADMTKQGLKNYLQHELPKLRPEFRGARMTRFHAEKRG
jgi:hypothetical protein